MKNKFDASPASMKEAIGRPSQLDGKSRNSSSKFGSRRARNEDARIQETHALKEELVEPSVEHSLVEQNLNETKALLNKENNQHSELDVQPPIEEQAASRLLEDEAQIQEHDELQIEDD